MRAPRQADLAGGEIGGAKARPIRLGVIGGGMMSQVGHLPFYLGDARCDVVSLCETRPSLVAALGERLSHTKLVAAPHDIYDDPNIDAVVIVAPRPAMGPLALDALMAGKHVLMEKPMAHSVPQARRLVEAAAASGKTLAVGFMKRHDPGIEAAHTIFTELIATGRFGHLVFGRFFNFTHGYAVPVPPHQRPSESRSERFAEWPSVPDWLPPGLRSCYAWFMNSASHNINLVNFFFPEPLVVASAMLAGDRAIIGTAFAGDVPIALEVLESAPGVWMEGFEFLFERGRLAVSIPSPMAMDKVAEITLQESGGAVAPSVTVKNEWSFARQARDFLTVLSEGRPARTSGADGLRDLELCESLWRRIAEQTHD